MTRNKWQFVASAKGYALYKREEIDRHPFDTRFCYVYNVTDNGKPPTTDAGYYDPHYLEIVKRVSFNLSS